MRVCIKRYLDSENNIIDRPPCKLIVLSNKKMKKKKQNGSTLNHGEKTYTRTLGNSKSNCKPICFFNVHANSGPRRFVEYRNTAHIHVRVTNWNLRSFAWILGCPLEHCCCCHLNHCCYCFGYCCCC